MSDAAGEILAVLGDLGDLAEKMIFRPASWPTRMPELAAISVRVDKARVIMIEGGNPIDAAPGMLLVVLTEIERADRGLEPGHLTHWRMLAGVLLPMVKDRAYRALKLRERMPSATEHDYPLRRPGDRT